MIFFSFCDFFAKDHPFVSFIALKIIYFFHFFFFFFSFLIFICDSFIVGCFFDFYNGYEAQQQQSVRVCQWPRTGRWRFYQVVSSDADVWLLGLSVPCVMFLFSFHEFQGEKKNQCLLCNLVHSQGFSCYTSILKHQLNLGVSEFYDTVTFVHNKL